MWNLRGKGLLLLMVLVLILVPVSALADEVTTENTENATENATESETEEPGVIRTDEDVVFYFNVDELPTVELLEEYDFSLALIRDAEDESYLGVNFKKDEFVLGVHYEETGRVPALAKIEIPVGIKYAGETLYYCEIDKNGNLEYKGIYGKVDNHGIFTVNYNHRFDSMLMTHLPEAVEEDDGFKFRIDATLVIILAAALINLAIYMTSNKKKKGKVKEDKKDEKQ